MVTKLRNFSRNIFLKILAFILISAALVVSFVAVMQIEYYGLDISQIYIDTYRQSYKFDQDMRYAWEYVNVVAQGRDDYNCPEGLCYWTKSDLGTEYSNTELHFFSEAKNVFHYDGYNGDGEGKFYEDGTRISRSSFPRQKGAREAYMAFTEEHIAEKEAKWQQEKEFVKRRLEEIAISMGIAILLSVYLVMVAGRKPKDNEVHYNVVDRIFTDIQIVLVILIVFLFMQLVDGWFYSSVYDGAYIGIYRSSQSVLAMLTPCGVVAVLFAIPVGVNLLSFVRKIKGRRFIKHSLIYWVLSRFVRLFKSLFDGRAFKNFPLTKALFWRQTIFVCSSIFIAALMVIVALSSYYNFSAFFVLGSILLLIESVILYWYLSASLKSYNEINKGMSDSLDEQMKSERMKVTLITNVSHDLKTPLTSIISYVDLLSKEELSPAAKDYVTILAQKSDRLKHIVSDLFELSKVTSGSITVDLERLDIKKLLEQTLADMEDSITESGLDFRQNLTSYPVYIMGDGKKLYRVLQNIIKNTLKYSLAGTRVFVSLDSDMTKVTIAVKNTSANEMAFTADEIMQRFYRGDQSRSTEGNGLGLSIAQGFTHACGGEFSVDIDGDLFKVTLSFKVDNTPTV